MKRKSAIGLAIALVLVATNERDSLSTPLDISAPPQPSVSPVGTARDLMVGLSAVAATLLAFQGVNAWRRQLKGTAEYQVARKVLKTVYAVREALIETRARFTFPSEWAGRAPEASGAEEFAVLIAAQSYRERLARLGRARAELSLVQQEALALWSEPAKEALEEVFGVIDELFATYDQYFDVEIARARRKDLEGVEEERDADSLVMNRLLYSRPELDGRDPFGKKIAKAVGRAEEFYRARLK